MLLVVLAGAGVLVWYFFFRGGGDGDGGGGTPPPPTPPPPPPSRCPAKLASKLQLQDYAAYNIFVLTSTSDVTSFNTAVTTMTAGNYGGQQGDAQKGQFNTQHYAFLVGPSSAPLFSGVLPIGYYTQVLGLAKDRTQVKLKTLCMGDSINALDTFWRGAENYTWIPATADEQNKWSFGNKYACGSSPSCTYAVSQMCPLRGCIVNDQFQYSTCCPDGVAGCFSSGGYSADNSFKSDVNYYSQQQWCSVGDVYVKTPGTPNWNGVFVNCQNAPSSPSPAKECWVVGSSKVLTNSSNVPRKSKPYLVLADDGKHLEMVVPDGVVNAQDKSTLQGNDFLLAYDECSFIDALNDEHTPYIVIASPQSIHINTAIEVKTKKIILGIGLPTLSFGVDGSLTVAANDCILAGVILEAGAQMTAEAMLTWSGAGWIYDMSTRVGGEINDCCCNTHVLITGHVTAENLWLWRADHDGTAGNPNCNAGEVGGVNSNRSYRGLVVEEGAHAICIGLASEHNLKDNVLWKGNGEVYFYQSELVYCPPSSGGDTFPYPAFAIGASSNFLGRGMGIYSYFNTAPCKIAEAVANASSTGVDLDGVIVVNLSGKGGIEAIVTKNSGDTLGCPVCGSLKNKTDKDKVTATYLKGDEPCAQANRCSAEFQACTMPGDGKRRN